MIYKNNAKLKTIVTIFVTILIVSIMSQMAVAKDSKLEKISKIENKIGTNIQHAFVWDNYNGMKDLTPGGDESDAHGINGKGEIVGYITVGGYRHASFWDKNYDVTDIGQSLGAIDNQAKVINDKDHAIIDTTDIMGNSKAYVWSKDTGILYLGSLGGSYSHAQDINNHGQIAGDSDTATGRGSFIWENGVMTNIGSLSGNFNDGTYAYDINEKGQIVGESINSAGKAHAYIWDKQHGMTDLGTLSGDELSIANAINDKGQVVGGSYNLTGERHAFIWEKGVMKGLGSLGGDYSEARDINNAGEVIGTSYVTPLGESHGFYWSQKTGMIDLGTLGGDWGEASHINERGQVLGDSNNAIPPAGYDRTYIWDKKNGMIDIGILSGFDVTWSHNINDKGKVIGHIE